MHSMGTASWSINVDRWNHCYDRALWIRAAERINAPAGGIVPGPIDIDQLPDPPQAEPGKQVAEGWLAWWHALLQVPSPTLPGSACPYPVGAFSPPDFSGLARWPALHEVVARRWKTAQEWHSARKRAGVAAMTHHGREPFLVREVERSLGRRVAPFSLDLVLLPVRNDKIRHVQGTRYLVPEHIYDAPGWAESLRALVVQVT